MVDRDAIDDFLDDIIGTVEPDYTDMSIVELFEGDEEALQTIESTIPMVNGRRVRSE